jgi:hypothetical protein
MEQVLRQRWIALHLADHLGMDDEQRAVVYYTALLTNVGCHTDAHEQAKWFGDDIALKGDKYAHGLQLSYTFALVDILPWGRQEEWQDSPDGWPQSPTYSKWLDSPDVARLYGPNGDV